MSELEQNFFNQLADECEQMAHEWLTQNTGVNDIGQELRKEIAESYIQQAIMFRKYGATFTK